MLTALHIENIAVIKNVDIDFKPGFTVLTGETGAGKSIIIDAISLLLGARFSKEMIRSGEESAMVSAYFSDISSGNKERLAEMGLETDSDGGIYLQRNISSDGKAQTRFNGRVIPLTLQKQAMQYLINIHGQNDNYTLLDSRVHIGLLDAYAQNEVLLDEYLKVYNKMSEVKRKISELNRDDKEKQRLIELYKYQIDDIDAAKLKPGEEEELDAKRKKIQNIEKITKHVKLIYRALYRNEKGASAFELINMALSSIEKISDIFPDSEEYIEKLNSFKYELEEIAQNALDLTDEENVDPTAALDKIESRLDIIYRLKRKYGSDISEILDFRNKAADDLAEIELSEEKIVEYNNEYNILVKQASSLSDRLNETRKKAALDLEKQIMAELAYLDMDKVKFSVDIKKSYNEKKEIEFNKNGSDIVEFLISTNPGEPLKPLSKIASGGELARIMLAVKCVFAGRESTETLIYDEIDTGISGGTSQKLGIKLNKSSASSQVLCVTHSAQIAAAAHNHYYVGKIMVGDRVETTVTELDYDSRVSEIARIMGGMQITEKLLATAAELIDYKL